MRTKSLILILAFIILFGTIYVSYHDGELVGSTWRAEQLTDFPDTIRSSTFEFDDAIYRVTIHHDSSVDADLALLRINESVDSHYTYGVFKLSSSHVFKSAVLEFRIDKNWFYDNGWDYSHILLLHKNNTWNNLSFEYVDDDLQYVYYASETEELGVFAITSLARNDVPDKESPDDIKLENILDEFAHDSTQNFLSDEPVDATWLVFGAIATMVVASFVLLFVFRKRKTSAPEVLKSNKRFERLMLHYIDSRLAEGADPENVRKALLAAGWEKSLLDRVLYDKSGKRNTSKHS